LTSERKTTLENKVSTVKKNKQTENMVRTNITYWGGTSSVVKCPPLH